MKDLIKITLSFTPSEANTFCNILLKGIEYYTNHQDTETVNPVWLWGMLADISTYMYKKNAEEEGYEYVGYGKRETSGKRT